MGRMDDLPYAIVDLETGGEDEWQDGKPPRSAQHQQPVGSGGTMDTELPIERLPATEQAAGVKLTALFAVSTDLGSESPRVVQVSGEISGKPDKEDNLTIAATVYDASGHVLQTLESTYFQDFTGWDAFIMADLVPGTPAKVRVFIRRP